MEFLNTTLIPLVSLLAMCAGALAIIFLIVSIFIKKIRMYNALAWTVLGFALVIYVAAILLRWVINPAPVTEIPTTEAPTAEPVEIPATEAVSVEAIHTQAAATVQAEFTQAAVAKPTSTVIPPTVQVQPTTTVIPPTAQPTSTPAPTTETLSGDNLPEGKTPEFYFEYGEIRVCTSVNGPWIPAFNNEETYTIDPASEYFPAGHYIQGEGVIVDSYPVDLHQNFILTEKVEMSQGNFWDCGDASTMTKADMLVNLFDNNNGKWGNWDSQNDPKVFHPMLVITPYGSFSYAKGERPAWVRGTLDLAASAVGIYTCSYDATELHEQDALPDQQKIITPGSAGCDFVAVRGSEAVRHEGVIERFPYKNGMLIFVFNPELSNSAVEEMLATNFELDVTVVDAP